MITVNKPAMPGVRTILHLSPSVYVAGLLSAQRRGLELGEFLDAAITAECAKGTDDARDAPPWSKHTVTLFLHAVDLAPETLEGAWKVLYARVLADSALWEAPSSTVGDIQDGAPSEGWRISEAALTKAWPRLVAGSFEP
jgi:hypothetical protein